MACRDLYQNQTIVQAETQITEEIQITEDIQLVEETQTTQETAPVTRFLFGVDSRVKANNILQNNLTQFEWVTRNKLYPDFWGRNIVGENCLSKEEIDFLRAQGCKIVAIFTSESEKTSEEQGLIDAKKAMVPIIELGIPDGKTIFLQIKDTESISMEYMRGYAKGLINEGFVPGFQANTDAKYDFDREFSTGLQTDKEVFDKCCVWAVAPNLVEYNNMTTTHLIHPDNWSPFAPSGITRADIAVWQYGKDCHPIQDDEGNDTSFNLNLVINERIIIEGMF